MPYIGQRPSKGDENNFKILDDISSYTLTFDGSDSSVVSAANDTITSLTHRFVQGQRVTYNKGGGTVIAGLSDGVYFIIKEDHNTIKLATSASNATNGIAVNITGVGGGSSHTLNVAFDGVNTKFKATHTNGVKAKITRSAQLVISMNGVIQQPHDTATPSTGFGFDLDGTIVFSQAPVSTDEYWAHVLTNNNVTFDISNNDIDNFTGNGSTVSFNLSKTPPDNRNVLVTIDGVIQYPNDPNGTVRSYTVVENVLTFVTAPASGVEIQVRHIGFAGSTSGSGGVTSFYGRTGAVVLKNTDNIVANNAEFAGNLTVQGTMTTLDTKVTEVDQLEVAANNTTVGVAITQSGTGDILNLYDGSTEVVSFNQHGNLTITNANPIINFIDSNNDSDYRIQVEAGSFLIEDLTNNHHDSFVIKNTKIGINDNNPERTLDVVGNNAMIQIEGSGGNGRQYSLCSTDDTTGAAVGPAGQFVIYDDTSSSNRLTIASGGQVGIGLTNPEVQYFNNLVVGNNAAGDKGITIRSNSGNSGILAFSDTDAADANRYDGYIRYSHADQHMSFYTALGNQRFTINEYGYVGVNTTQHSINGMSRYLSVSARNITNGGAAVEIVGNRTGSDQTLGVINFVNNVSNVAQITAKYQGSTTNGSLQFFTSGGERLRISSDGKVGINTNNPLSGVHISDGTAYGSPQNSSRKATLTISAGSEASADIQLLSANYNHIFFGDSTDPNTGIIHYNHTGSDTDSMNFVTAGTQKLKIASNGRLTSTRSTTTAYNAAATTNDSSVVISNSGAAGHATLQFQSLSSGTAQTGQATISVFNESSGSKNTALTFGTRQNSDATIRERLRITSTGLIRMGNGAEANTEAHITAAIFQNTTGAATILKLGNTNTPSSANNRAIEFCDGTGGTEGSSKYTYARIRAERSGGSNAGRLMFFTKPDNSSDATEKLRINHSGLVEIKNFDGRGLHLQGSSDPHIRVEDTDGTNQFGDFANNGGESYIVTRNNTNHGSFKIYSQNGSETLTRLLIDSSGRVMIANVHANNMFAGADDLVVGTTSGGRGITIISENNAIGRLLFSDSTSSGTATYQGQINYNHSTEELDLRTYTAGSITASTSNTERLRIDSNGRLLINKTSNRDKYFNGTYTGQLQVEGTNDATRLTQFIHNSNNASGHIFVIGKSRGGVGSYTAVADDDYLGTISFQGADGDEMVDAARIEVRANGTPSDDNMPADMIFRTNSGSVSPTERLRIPKTGGIKLSNTAGGNLLDYGGSTVSPNAAINITRYGTGYADIRLASNYGAGISFAGASDNTDEYRISQDNQKNAYHYLEYNGFINFATNTGSSTTAMRLQSGKVGIGKFLETLTGNGFHAALQVSNKTTDGYGTIMMGGGYNRATIGIGNQYDLIITSNAYPANATSNGIIFKTGTDGGGGPHERLRINSSGQVKAIEAGFDSRWGDTLDVTIDTASWAANTFYRVVNDNVFDSSNDTYLVWFKWSHDGSGAPWLITGNFLWTPTGANTTGAVSPVITPVQTAHNSASTISFRGEASGNVRPGLSARADGWNPSGGDLVIKASKIGHPYA